jgi:hypothetical protein
MERAGITSDSPTRPIAKGSWVSSYTHQPTRVFIMRNPIMKQNRPSIRFLYSGIRIAAKGSLVTCEVVEFSSIQYARKGKWREGDTSQLYRPEPSFEKQGQRVVEAHRFFYFTTVVSVFHIYWVHFFWADKTVAGIYFKILLAEIINRFRSHSGLDPGPFSPAKFYAEKMPGQARHDCPTA